VEKKSNKEIIEEIYHINRWGKGFFCVNKKGNLTVLPGKDINGLQIDLHEVLEEIKEKKIQLPVVIRFHDILRYQVLELNQVFSEVIKTSNYQGKYIGVYPIKVNQMREVVEEILDAGKEFSFGLEAGSKPELLSVLAMNQNHNSLTILNGYKDKDYLKLGLIGRVLGKNTIIVIEKFSELKDLIGLAKKMEILPYLGIRVKLSVLGSGKWSDSSGEKTKFGLTVSEILNGVEL
jgi:arginine decarboxylase